MAALRFHRQLAPPHSFPMVAPVPEIAANAIFVVSKDKRTMTDKSTGHDMPATYEQLSPEMRALPKCMLLRHDEAAGKPLNTEAGRLTLRLSTELLLDVPLNKRNCDWERDWTMRELADRLWPSGWDRDRDIKRLVGAICRVDEIRFPTTVDGVDWQRKMFQFPLIPLPSASPDSPFPVTVPHPAAAGSSGLVYLPTLRELGTISDCAYRLGLGLAKVWSETDLHPELSEDDLALLCYPTLFGEANQSRRKTLTRKIKLVLWALRDRGICEIELVSQEDGSSSWRILAPEGWGPNYGR